MDSLIRVYVFCLFLIFQFTGNTVLAKGELPVEIKQLLLQGNKAKAIEKLTPLANEENSAVQYQLAVLLLENKNLSSTAYKENVAKAIKLLEASATDNSASAFLLGSLYYKGKKIAKDHKLAERYLNEAKSRGHKRAATLLRKLNASHSGKRIKPQTQRLFQLAVKSGNLSLVVKQYLNGANLNHPNDEGDPAVVSCVRSDRKNILQWLIQQGAVLDAQDNVKNTALHIAAQMGQLGNVILLANRLDSIDPVNRYGQTPLMMAIENRHKETAQWLINKKASFTLKDRNNRTAKDYNKIAGLDLLFSVGSNEKRREDQRLSQKQIEHQLINLEKQKQNSDGRFFNWPLSAIASTQGQTSLAIQILKSKESPWRLTPEGESAWSIAIESKNKELIDWLLKNNPINKQMNPKRLGNLFEKAILTGANEPLKQSLKQLHNLKAKKIIHDGLRLAMKNQQKKSAIAILPFLTRPIAPDLLILAIENNEFKVTAWLLDHGVLTSSFDPLTPPIIAAAKANNAQAIELLVQHNIEINETDSQGFSGLHWAVKRNAPDAVKSLILSGAKVDQTTRSGNTALMLAADGKPKLIELLSKYSTDISLRNKNSLTALMLASKNQCLLCVKYLLEKDANPNRKSESGKSAFDFARGNQAILELLENA